MGRSTGRCSSSSSRTRDVHPPPGTGGVYHPPAGVMSILPAILAQSITIIFCAAGSRVGSARSSLGLGGFSAPAPAATECQGTGGHCSAAVHGGTSLVLCLSRCFAAANLVLHQTVERIHVGKKYGDIPRGIFVVRGENVVLLGEIDLEKESDTPLQQVSIEEILEEQRVEQQAKQESEKLKVQALKERGLSVPRADTLDEY
ncbi:U6 snRNA-associated Sm-like protein LSm1 isoform X1 [Melospiza georgiana]|uniref:U6 snRNA-associated Sm-like protein LSm1 isoform X1 n=1 Tax=Melospiza georgiana TaxID=44398 RepID=UPI0025AC4871|nr:U6 snRNA-associated Sm-like protein LSm1 isoform X1 [Melospiza georgiana]